MPTDLAHEEIERDNVKVEVIDVGNTHCGMSAWNFTGDRGRYLFTIANDKYEARNDQMSAAIRALRKVNIGPETSRWYKWEWLDRRQNNYWKPWGIKRKHMDAISIMSLLCIYSDGRWALWSRMCLLRPTWNSMKSFHAKAPEPSS